MELWNICEEITSKENWYSKVFDPEIVSKWRSELPVEAGNNFVMAVRILQASAQGVRHLEDCEWTDEPICNDCKKILKQELRERDSGEDDFSEDDNWIYKNEEWAEENCQHPRCKCIPPDCQLGSYVEYFPLGVLPKDLHSQCQEIIAEMAAKEAIDWHPGSDQQVRDLIHPSMYCYVKGVSKHADGTVAPVVDESVRYQWLPSEFSIDENSKVTVKSYINNLGPDKYPRMIPLIEKTFEKFLPSVEAVLRRPLQNRSLQVIVKVGSIILTLEKPNYPGGSWHLEGMPHEHIAATCLHYVDMRNISDSFLEFRKPTIIDEMSTDYPQNDRLHTTHHYGITPDSHHGGSMNRYLGVIKCDEGASVTFQNIQHHVKEFSLTPGADSSLRTILAFFVIDPDHRIVSTKDVAPQQGLMTLQKAQYYRERLMYYRKYFVDAVNEKVFERPFSLCEH